MKPLRPGWVRRWPSGYLGPQGQVITSSGHGWNVTTFCKNQSTSRWAPNLEAAQLTGEQEYARLAREAS